jgi:hypothetical protein
VLSDDALIIAHLDTLPPCRPTSVFSATLFAWWESAKAMSVGHRRAQANNRPPDQIALVELLDF